jgi:carbon storage regulator
MLVLSRKRGEHIRIGDNIDLTVLEVRGNVVRLGFTASGQVAIHRQEVYDRIQKECGGSAGLPAPVLADLHSPLVAQSAK